MTFEYKGNSFAYAEYGDKKGFPILIQHGMIASIKDYQLFHSLIESRRRVICIARPGYAESFPYKMNNVFEWGRIISVLVHELGVKQFDILGTSSGAPYSYSIAYVCSEMTRNVYIFSGTPALYIDQIAAEWLYPIDRRAQLPELQKLANELFFSNLSIDALHRNDIVDSQKNDCFGIALDLQIRCIDWGFDLSKVKAMVYMQHSKTDNQVPFITAEMTSRLLMNCKLEIRETGDHFSDELLDQFIKKHCVGN